MRKKIVSYLIISILCGCLYGCSGNSSIDAAKESDEHVESSAADTAKDDSSSIPGNTSEPFVGKADLDGETSEFFYGTWKVDKLLGFANSYNDASEDPTGQKVIGDEIIINEDFFSSKGFKDYGTYQYELDKPLYNITEICYNKDSFYRLFKMDMPSINMDDQIKALSVSDSSTGMEIPVSFLDVNNDRLILVLEATEFELTRVPE